ncbi:MAG: serine/threonine-protein kinase [Myxococcota bacterium]|nr:serine/threonine-protein kinase [Myxococcota bacterium]
MQRICPACDVKTEEMDCPDCGRRTVEAARLQVKTQPDPFIGAVIEGKYEVTGKIGRGGMASVYKATHKETGGEVAIKLIRADKLEDENHIRRFYIEAQNTHQLHHPNTIRVSDFGQTEDGILYMVMEYVRGETLKEIMKQEGRLSPARAVRIVEQVLKCLGEAHSHKVIHRDIKPDNIMLIDQFGEPDFVKVLDFGVSRSLESSGASTRGAIGTPKYMAPEQWRGRSVDGRADLYSVGVVMYYLLAGQLPFSPDTSETDSAIAYMNAHVKEPPTPLVHFARDTIPAELADFVMWLLRKDPDERPSDSLMALTQLKQIGKTHDLSEEVQPLPDGPVGAGSEEFGFAPTMIPTTAGIDLDTAGAETRTLNPPASRSSSASGTGDSPADSSTSVLAADADALRAVGAGGGNGMRYAIAGVAIAAAAVVGLVVTSGGEGPEKDEATEATPAAVTANAAEEAAAAAAVAEEKAAAVEPAATVEVTSEPPGAKVTSGDGALLGKTPLTLTADKVAAGATVKVTLDGFRDLESPTFTYPEAGKNTVLNLALKALPRLSVLSHPTGATVRVEGIDEPIGTTPISWYVPAKQADALMAGGPVKLTFEKEGFHPATKVLKQDLFKDGDASLAIQLRSLTAKVSTPKKKKKAPAASAPKPAPKPKAKPKPKKKDGWSF